MFSRLAFLLALAVSFPSLAIQPFVIRDIRVEGVQRTEAGTVFTYLPLKVGDRIDDEKSAQLGWITYLGFLALVSVSLGVLNLLPIPLLDGGHLVYYLAEIVKGSPVSERVMEIGQRFGLALLLGLTFVAFYNDINRLFTG